MRIDGLLLVDKPEGLTSLDVVREIKSRFSIRKAGHVGTLDPFATGLLPVALNEGTKLIPFLPEEPKAYEGALKVGEETRTDDLTGDIVRRKPWEDLTPERIEAVFRSFRGEIEQVPPMFSAVKVGGRPLYKIARKGLEIERRPRVVVIHELEVDHVALPIVLFRVSCSKGTYIRALARDIGQHLGCGAHLVSLRRTRSGPFTLEKALSIERLRAMGQARELLPHLIPLREALEDLPEMVGDERLIRKVRQGQELRVGDLLPQPLLPPFEKGQKIRMTSPHLGLVAILETALRADGIDPADPGQSVLRPLRIFHSTGRSQAQGG
ncbi:MAG: tRNA pseudouridine(55) synthase TruB [Desulfobacterota bacterium]|nr:tRNA pseudouridine(55) synthase TruB [Thermodesulfobacteriota bacterium]